MVELSKTRPLRDLAEETLQEFDGGPLEVTGEGNLIGGAGYITVRAVNNTLVFGSLGLLGGIKVGVRVISHGVNVQGEEEVHTMRLSAYSQDVARFAAKYLTAPSNVDFALRRVDVTQEELLRETRTASTWEMKTRVSREAKAEQ